MRYSQLIENYRKKDASSLSPILLTLWFLGDGSNLLGALLTGQLFTQVFFNHLYVITV
jgi:hypothetical protein